MPKLAESPDFANHVDLSILCNPTDLFSKTETNPIYETNKITVLGDIIKTYTTNDLIKHLSLRKGSRSPGRTKTVSIVPEAGRSELRGFEKTRPGT